MRGLVNFAFSVAVAVSAVFVFHFVAVYFYILYTGVFSRSELSEDYGLAMLLVLGYVVLFFCFFAFAYSWVSKRRIFNWWS